MKRILGHYHALGYIHYSNALVRLWGRSGFGVFDDYNEEFE